MASLDDIQSLVDEAIRVGDVGYARRVLWPQIKMVVSQSMDIPLQIRRPLLMRIAALLDEQGLQGANTRGPVAVSVRELVLRLQEERFSPEPGEPIDLPLPPEDEPLT